MKKPASFPRTRPLLTVDAELLDKAGTENVLLPICLRRKEDRLLKVTLFYDEATLLAKFQSLCVARSEPNGARKSRFFGILEAFVLDQLALRSSLSLTFIACTAVQQYTFTRLPSAVTNTLPTPARELILQSQRCPPSSQQQAPAPSAGNAFNRRYAVLLLGTPKPWAIASTWHWMRCSLIAMACWPTRSATRTGWRST